VVSGKETNQVEVVSGKETNKFDSKLAKDLVLAIWLIFLLVIGILAVQGKASSILIDLNLKQYLKFPGFTNTTNNPNIGNLSNASQKTPVEASQRLQDYLAKVYANQDPVLIPPVTLVLDRLQLDLNWRDLSRIGQVNATKNPPINPPTDADYDTYFDAVTKRLESIATYTPVKEGDSSTLESAKPLQIRNDIVPPVFRGPNFRESDIDLPPEAVLWVQQKKKVLIQKNNQLSLLDTFVLLIILGGFGSWIFLVRSHINRDEESLGLRAYIYRPLLGMALALAVFIVDVSLHSVVSTAKMDQIRRETLILLAFAAGLLSEKTYQYVEGFVNRRLDQAEEDARVEDANKGQQKPDPEHPQAANPSPDNAGTGLKAPGHDGSATGDGNPPNHSNDPHRALKEVVRELVPSNREPSD
jgi:hypothetical protein